MSNSKLKIVECPRDAMQGIKTFIPTNEKVRYIQSLLGFSQSNTANGRYRRGTS